MSDDATPTQNPFTPNLPAAIAPKWKTATANEELTCYDGKVEVVQNGVTILGSARIYLQWYPTCTLRFDAKLTEAVAEIKPILELDRIEIKLVDNSDASPVEANITRIKDMFQLSEISGTVREVLIGDGSKLAKLMFHLPNYPNFRAEPIRSGLATWLGRNILEANGWRIILDQLVDRIDAKQLKTTGMSAITHVGSIERSDGSLFAASDADDLIECLRNFFSFTKSHWTGPLLFVGFDEGDEAVFEHHVAARVTPERSRWQWIDETLPKALVSLFPGFATRWFDPTWQDVIRTCVYFYVDANLPDRSAEGGIIQHWAIFEAIGWMEFVGVGPGKYAAKKFYGMKGHKKLSLLLRHYGIDPSLPARLVDLRTEAAKEKKTVTDGVGAIAVIRNAFTHPSPSNRRLMRATEHLTMPIFLLAGTYSGLCLLRLFGYEGTFFNYFKGAEWDHEAVDLVPWSK